MLYGKERLLDDLRKMDFNVEPLADTKTNDYILIRDYNINVGPFIGKMVDLALPVPNDYPRTVGSSLHIRSSPQLLDFQDTIPGKRNIIKSDLGDDWRYWSFRFNLDPENSTLDFISQINGIFRNI